MKINSSAIALRSVRKEHTLICVKIKNRWRLPPCLHGMVLGHFCINRIICSVGCLKACRLLYQWSCPLTVCFSLLSRDAWWDLWPLHFCLMSFCASVSSAMQNSLFFLENIQARHSALVRLYCSCWGGPNGTSCHWTEVSSTSVACLSLVSHFNIMIFLLFPFEVLSWNIFLNVQFKIQLPLYLHPY